MSLRARLLTVVALALAGAALSFMLLLQHHGESLGMHAVEAICGEGGGCGQVNSSSYSSLGGVPLAGIGLLFYVSIAALLLLAAVADGEAVPAAAFVGLLAFGAGLLIDAVLLSIQAFAIHAYCALCLTTYALNVAALVLLLPARTAAANIRATLPSPLGRLWVAGWLLATIGAGWAVVAADTALLARAGQRQALLLGTPGSGSTPSTSLATLPQPRPGESQDATLARYRDEVQKVQEQSKRLQDTLDDPVKLQQYQDAKASREFDEAKVQQVDLSQTPSKGAPAGPIRVVEYSDFLCPWCRNLAQAFAGYLPQSGGRLTIYFKQYPLDKTCNPKLNNTIHPGSCWMALGGICAQEQGKFWPYHDKAFGKPPENPGRDDVLRIGGEAGLSVPALETCLASPKTQEQLKADIAEGQRVGVTGTPTLLINGKKLPRLNDFLQALEKESKRLGMPPLPPPQG